MSQVALSDSAFNQLESLDLDDLFANLALTDAGAASHVGMALTDLKSFKTAAMASDTSASDFWGWLIAKGKALFDKIWPTAKGIVCQIYKATGSEDPTKDWLTIAATALASTLGLGAAAAVLIIRIAMKYGMDAMCPA